MNLATLKSLLQRHPPFRLRFVLPDGDVIPAHFHITEVGHVHKTFIDCAGTARAISACVLQAWIMPGDRQHVLTAGKLAHILDLARAILPDADLPVEVEYEAPSLSQYSIESAALAEDAIVFHLAPKHTACRAMETCGPDCATSFCCISDGVAA